MGQPTPGTEPTLEDILKDDHEEIDGFWQQAGELRARNEPLTVSFYRKFVGALDEHIEIEEHDLFPFSRNTRGEAVQHLLEVLQTEHREIRKLLGKMSSDLDAGRLPSPDDETELRNILWTHNAREEGMFYPDFGAHFADTPEGRKLTDEVRARCHCGHR